MLPNRNQNIYPKTDQNIQAIIDFYFSEFNVDRENAVEALQKTTLSLNQIEYIIKKLSQAYIPIFTRHLNTRPIQLSNLITYGIEALVNAEIKNGSVNRREITKEFQKFAIEN